jgi:AcrR family transcriptional regulator
VTYLQNSDTRKLGDSKRERILQAALEEIVAHGVVGFRIVDVSDKADCAVSLIYRHFLDRNGLIKAVLSRIVLHHIDQWETLRIELSQTTTRDIDAILARIPSPESDFANMARWLRVQSLAASVGDDELRNFLAEETQRYHNVVKALLIDVRRHLGLSTDGDLDALVLLWCSLGLVLTSNDLVQDGRINDKQFRAFLKKILMID